MYIEWIRFITGTFLFVVGLITFGVEIFGNYKFGYVLNRMHAASIGDSIGIVLCLVGLMIFSGLSFLTLKLGAVVVFLWFSTPICTHLVAKMETETNEEIQKECEVEDGCRF